MGRTGNFLLGILTGAVAGAVAGILLAPDKGVRMRCRIMREVDSLRERASDSIGDKVEDMRDDIADFFNDLGERCHDIEARVRSNAEKAESHTEE